MRVPAFFILSMVLCLPAQALAQQGGRKIQCWTDHQGQRACGDRVPPEYAQQERRVYGGDGRLLEIRERPRTAEELAEIERLRQAELEARREDGERRAYDQFLLSTFNSVRELERMRDQRLAMLDGRIGLARKAIEDNRAALKRLWDQAGRAQADNKKVPDRVQRQIDEFEKTLAGNLQSVEQMEVERGQIEQRFAADVERLRHLRQAAGLTLE